MRTKTICFSIILAVLLLATGFCYADDIYEIDPFTGQIKSSTDGSDLHSQIVRISSNCSYNRGSDMYVYSTAAAPNTDVACSVYTGEIAVGRVEIEIGEAASIDVFRDGVLLEPSTIYSLERTGAYVVRDRSTDKEVVSFRIISDLTGDISSYAVPNACFITSIQRDGLMLDLPANNVVSLTEEGFYEISYRFTQSDSVRKLRFGIDHTFPELLINGVENGIASGPVTFGETEPGSELAIYLNGERYEMLSGVLKRAGNYHIVYTDKAGNASTYDFTMRVFFDLSAWFSVAVVALLIGSVLFFMIRSRRHMRTY